MDKWEVFEELCALRAQFSVQHAIKGFGIDYEEALELIRNYDEGLSDEDRAKREILVAAVDNVVDFAVAAESQLLEDVEEYEDYLLDDDEYTEEDMEEEEAMLYALCQRYNYTYANVENSDIEYAMFVAAGLLAVKHDEYIIYLTQGDERVRPWHLQYDGYTAPKSSFPRWLIPPIEHQCRCFLDTQTSQSVIGSVLAKKALGENDMPEWFNPVLKESVAFGGRIFSEEHSYFQVSEKYTERLRKIASRIKGIYFKDLEP